MTDSTDPVCSRCGDTQVMWLHNSIGDSREVPCTSCPTPCAKCRAGGKGAYCETARCPCDCHRKADSTDPGAVTHREARFIAHQATDRPLSHEEATKLARYVSQQESALTAMTTRVEEAEARLAHLRAELRCARKDAFGQQEYKLRYGILLEAVDAALRKPLPSTRLYGGKAMAVGGRECCECGRSDGTHPEHCAALQAMREDGAGDPQPEPAPAGFAERPPCRGCGLNIADWFNRYTLFGHGDPWCSKSCCRAHIDDGCKGCDPAPQPAAAPKVLPGHLTRATNLLAHSERDHEKCMKRYGDDAGTFEDSRFSMLLSATKDILDYLKTDRLERGGEDKAG